MDTDLATMIPRTTRTGDADTIRTARVLLTMVMAVHMPMSLSSALLEVALSLWIVLGLGLPMGLVTMIPRTTRTGDADSTR